MAVGTARDRRFIGIEAVERHLRRRFSGAIDTSGVADQDLLRWDATNSKWVVTSDPVVDSIDVNGDMNISGNIVGDGTGMTITGGDEDGETLTLRGNSVDAKDKIKAKSGIDFHPDGITFTANPGGTHFSSTSTIVMDYTSWNHTAVNVAGTLEWGQVPAIPFGSSLFQSAITHKQTDGETLTAPSNVVYTVSDISKVQAQGTGNLRIGTLIGLNHAPSVEVGSGSGTTRVDQIFAVNCAGAIKQGTTTSRAGVVVENATGAGTLTGQAGLWTKNGLSKGTNNTHLLLASASIPSGNWGIHCASTWDNFIKGKIFLNTTTGPSIQVGTNSPNTVVTAAQGSIFIRTNGGSGSTIYANHDGATGWHAL